MTVTWQQLYDQAVATCQPRDVSDSMYVGSVAAAILTARGDVYTGISIDTACSIGYCAERNALGSMLTAGATDVVGLVAVRGRDILLPCGVCREFRMQLGQNSGDIEILTSIAPIQTTRLATLYPNFWNV